MVKRAKLKNVTGIAGAAGASAPSGSASLTNLRIEYLPPERLRPSANNARTHAKKQLKQIARSIKRFGFVNPILITDDFAIIAGHGRVEAAKMLGLKQVPTVRLSNLSPADRRAYVIADNRLAELAGWDRDLLATELQGLVELQFEDLELTGFSLGEIDRVLDDAAGKTAEQPEADDDLPALGPTISRPRDLWLLGPHRLLCGEFDLLSCDGIVRRWQQDTDKAARLEGPDPALRKSQLRALLGQAHHRLRPRGITDMSQEFNPMRTAPPDPQSLESRPTDRARPSRSAPSWPWPSTAGQAVEERWPIAKSSRPAAQGRIAATGCPEGIRAGHQQEDLG